MIIEPRMRGFICLTAHPDGCAQNVKNQPKLTSCGPIWGLRPKWPKPQVRPMRSQTQK
jgi:trans-2-enoyl-CoA reductase